MDSDICYSSLSGLEVLRNAKYCKGLAFNIEERQILGKFSLIITTYLRPTLFKKISALGKFTDSTKINRPEHNIPMY